MHMNYLRIFADADADARAFFYFYVLSIKGKHILTVVEQSNMSAEVRHLGYPSELHICIPLPQASKMLTRLILLLYIIY